MDGDARLIVCEKTPKCVAVNLSGWMKHSLVIDAVSKPVKTKRLYLKVPINATSDELAHIKEYFLQCIQLLPGGRLPKEKK